MELRHLRYYVAVVEAGSFTAAAAVLHVSQPPLSVAIAQLEAELGAPLLVRSSRGVEPTSAGRALLDSAARILGDVDGMVEAIGRFGAGTAGTLTLAAVPALMWHRVPSLLRSYAAEAPDVEVRLVDPPPWQAIELVEQRSADLAAIMVADPRRFIRRHGARFSIADWGEIPLVAVLPPETEDAPDPFPLAGFDGADLVLPRRTAAVPSLPEAVERALQRHGVVPRSIRTTETIQTGLPFVESGLAWAILPDPDHASLSRFDVVVRPLAPAPAGLRALVLARPGGGEAPATARLLAHLSRVAA